MLAQLKLEKSRKGLLVRIYDECGPENEGTTLDFTHITGCYIVVIRPVKSLKDIGLALAHELVHVRQLAKGVLKTDSKGVNYWAGKRYGKKVDYLDLPWEVEAFSKQELILRRAVQS